MKNENIESQFVGKETPFYYYDLNVLEETLDAAYAASSKRGFHVHFALKSNFNSRLLEMIQSKGFGADCVSGNEVQQAINAGFDAKMITFAGVGKSDKEINLALAHDIFAFNVESIQELEVINELAAVQGRKAKVALRINPNVDAHTHHYITTGLDENKFGVTNAELERAAAVIRKCENIELIGLHFHIGSQITDMNVFKSLCVKVNEWKNWFEERGVIIKVLNVGGGLGVDYHNPDTNAIPDFEAYFDIFDKFLERTPQQEVHFELGRALVAQCGSLISKVLYVKNGVKKNFLILDAGMTELMRPALYQAFHKIEKLGDANATELINYDVVGPICESSDCFGKEVTLPLSKRGDLVAIRTAGAYGEVMSSRYNLREEIRYVYSDELV
ncbi:MULTISPECIES: diaminopimelate decarboxylase [Sphingobacterium]|jgi:diaminopimelate decarboxylase|uniref:diaminopimelate decarboxylase n=1 Tax=Sphingobacterium TaxID=28453 RepID=UPI000389F3FE|nr:MULTISPECIES: diaminopimelate decarboxylase [Sphingobacterium]KKX50980.1 diaminopimelate decarboxylase [Sphingobacterium sp. IITKGP-BTPF85]MBB2951752.1 diaminopimelate decarboxylase [Sphingobacterium sp. JUb56]MCS3557115.1 diaminopimelate decarboxylase [Sphingobacterium sp. JUb21]MCW2260267.1 diaminopimelate decarboxylase [Sphingobacterium kitahiroshimense]NJI71827.1 diaminopimelate decarboxylase [Sphingobacterium sp. B16(2022)]